MRLGTLLIIIFIITMITIQLYAVLELYKKLKNQTKHKNDTNSDKLRFDSYLRDFNKTYNKEEYKRRFKNFKVSLAEIARLNLMKLGNNTVYGLTKFSDMSKEEFRFDSYLRNFKTNKAKTEIDVEVLDLDKLRFDIYLRDFDKSYNKEEYKRRFKNFKASLEEINKLNKPVNITVFGLTYFSDMSKEEFGNSSYMRNFKTNQAKTEIDVEVLDLDKIRFDIYLRDFDKAYNKEEYKRRFKNFKASLEDIARLNKLENNKVFGLTKFSDMSKEEFADRMLLKPKNIPPCEPAHPSSCSDSRQNKPSRNKKSWHGIPRSFDWRTRKGFVKPVLNQKRCQGCWAFSIVGVMETMSAIQLNDTRSRSIQELLDCSPYNNGCYNGSVKIAMQYICPTKLQFVTEEEYPMTLSMDKTCKLPTNGYHGIRVNRYDHTCNMDENLMVQQISSHGPLVVAVDSSNWLNYIGGVITRACTPWVSNHVVQIVGYEGYRETDAKTPIPYYIVRNSFGEDWGDQGYAKVAMKHGDLHDVCGIAEQVTEIDVCDPSRPGNCL